MSCISSPPTPPPQIYSTSSRIHIWNLVEGLRWSLFVETVNVGCFSKGAPSLMFDGILNAMRCLRLSSLGLHKEILSSPCLLILLIHTRDKDNKMKILDWPHVPIFFKKNSQVVTCVFVNNSEYWENP